MVPTLEGKTCQVFVNEKNGIGITHKEADLLSVIACAWLPFWGYFAIGAVLPEALSATR